MRAVVAAWWDELPESRKQLVLEHRRGELPGEIATSLMGAGIPVTGPNWGSNTGGGTNIRLPEAVQEYLDEDDV
jgi:hypothetical protein